MRIVHKNGWKDIEKCKYFLDFGSKVYFFNLILFL